MSLDNLILFDLDNTLFNSNRFIELIRVNLAVLTGSNDIILKRLEEKYRKQSIKLSFNPLHYSEFIGREFNVTPSKLFQQFTSQKQLYIESLFTKTISILGLLRAKGFQAGIFSEGNLDFQRMKIDNSGIGSYIDANLIYLYENKLALSSIKSLPVNAIVIDDNPKVIYKLNKQGIRVIWINRFSNKKHPSVPTIFSLNELETFIFEKTDS